VDRQSCFVVATNIAHGAAPLREAVGPALVRGLHAAKARPGALHVDNETLAAVLRPACQAIGVPLSLDHELNAAYDALDSLEQHFAR